MQAISNHLGHLPRRLRYSKPRVVQGGANQSQALVTNGDFRVKGTVFFIGGDVHIAFIADSATLAGQGDRTRSIEPGWLSVPPETTRRPALVSRFSQALGVGHTCWCRPEAWLERLSERHAAFAGHQLAPRPPLAAGTRFVELAPKSASLVQVQAAAGPAGIVVVVRS